MTRAGAAGAPPGRCVAGARGTGTLAPMTSALFVASQGTSHEVHTQLPIDPLMYGVIALVAFMALLGLLWSFRNTLALSPGKGPEDAAAGRDADH
jgi:hypothetical protein